MQREHMTPAPNSYTPEYCEAIRSGCEAQMRAIKNDVVEVKGSVNKVESRIFTLLVLAIGQILLAAGSVFAMWMTERGHLIMK